MKTLHFICLFLIGPILFTITGCGEGSDELTVTPVVKKTTKEITAFSFGGNSDVVDIDHTKGLIHVKALWRPQGWQLRPTISHNGLNITPTPNTQDYSKPQKFNIIAEDGSSKEYTVIVSSAWANYVDVKSAQDATIYTHDGGYHNVLEAFEEQIATGNKALTIVQGGSNASYTNRNNFHFVNTLKVPMVSNTYLRTHTFTTRRRYPYLFPEATGYLMVSRGSSNYWKLTPESGMIQITAYDKTHNMVSGNFKELKYASTSSSSGYPHELSRGGFMNIVIK
ncbi:hypothetical protein DR864_13335 [Runella rosea]|uniref:Uncharacterized protein n=1 Tax=Runella rosea TaxID=2259595 RepID=A0A344TJ44_9BACT|nr:hypothetical protein [Runella rosea]AXE18665.1 hypothetical protein DR864_13335 [Runella rosea]